MWKVTPWTPQLLCWLRLGVDLLKRMEKVVCPEVEYILLGVSSSQGPGKAQPRTFHILGVNS